MASFVQDSTKETLEERVEYLESETYNLRKFVTDHLLWLRASEVTEHPATTFAKGIVKGMLDQNEEAKIKHEDVPKRLTCRVLQIEEDRKVLRFDLGDDLYAGYIDLNDDSNLAFNTQTEIIGHIYSITTGTGKQHKIFMIPKPESVSFEDFLKAFVEASMILKEHQTKNKQPETSL